MPGAARYLPVAGVAAVVSVLGCSSDRGTGAANGDGSGAPATPRIETVAMIGDSITVGSEDALRSALQELGVETLAIDAENGRRMTASGFVGSGTEAAARVTTRDPDLWVVALGTNDVGIYDGRDEYRMAIEELLGTIPAGVPLVWVDIHVDSTPAANDEFNTTLAAALDDRGNATIVNWSAVAAGNGMLSDGIHPSGAGVEAFAELVSAGVANWLS
ncbi:MAG: hypothetical protein H0W46_01335 [Acidimicrobiia bacterium]|nr:hypothetical protein [Acidimicrobiia bacterium]